MNARSYLRIQYPQCIFYLCAGCAELEREICFWSERRNQWEESIQISTRGHRICHSLNSTSNQVESDKVISWTTTTPHLNF